MKNSILILVLLFNCVLSFSQHVSFVIENSNILSRTFFDQEADDFFEFGSFFSDSYNRNKPRKPLLYSTINLGLDIYLNETNLLGISGRFTQKGQRSGYQYNFGPDTPLLSPLYGGYVTYLRHSSIELGLNYSRNIFQLGPIEGWLGIGPGIDVFMNNHYKHYFFRKENGLTIANAESKWNGRLPGTLREKIKFSFDEMRTRVYLSSQLRLIYPTRYDWLTVSGTLGVNGYSRLLLAEDNPINPFIPDGHIIAGVFNIGIRINL